MNMQYPTLSIIIPVYNVEKYLTKCLDSLLNQSFTDFEAIIVDDGSTDNSGKVLDEYASRDARLKVIHIENGGVSNARNVALSNAVGKYIGFVDADDEVDEFMYQKLIDEAQSDDTLDMVQCQYLKVYENQPFQKGGRKNSTLVISENDKIMYEWFLNEKIHHSLWTKIFKREIVENVKFNIKFAMAEDDLFVFECCRKMKRIKIIDYIGYYYLQRESSAIHQKFNKKYFTILDINDIYKTYYDKNSSLYKMIACNEATACVNMILGIMRENVFKERFEELRKRLLKNKWKVFFSGHCAKNTRIATLLIWLSPGLLKKIYGVVIKRREN